MTAARCGDHHVGQLARRHADVGAHHRVGVAIVGDDVIGALRQQHDVAGRDVRHQRGAVAAFELAALVDRERNLVLRNLAGADAAFDAQPAGRKHEGLAIGFGLQRHRAHRADEAERDVHDVVAGLQHEVRRRVAILPDHLEGAVLVRPVGEDPPHQTAVDVAEVLAVARRQRQHGLPGCCGALRRIDRRHRDHRGLGRQRRRQASCGRRRGRPRWRREIDRGTRIGHGVGRNRRRPVGEHLGESRGGKGRKQHDCKRRPQPPAAPDTSDPCSPMGHESCFSPKTRQIQAMAPPVQSRSGTAGLTRIWFPEVAIPS